MKPTDTEITRCEDALRHLAAHIDGELDGALRSGMEEHLETCRSCFSRAEFEKRLKAKLEGLREEPPRPELEVRVHSLIRHFAVAAAD